MNGLLRSMTISMLVIVVVGLFVATGFASFHDRFIVLFPQAVKGTLSQVYYETFIVVSNPGPDMATVTLGSALLTDDVPIESGANAYDYIKR